MQPIYLDYNATTPIDPRVVEAMRPFLDEHFGNPASSHVYGRVTREAVARARGQVAKMLGCSPEEIVFTSGGTEANNMAIIGLARARKARGRHIITSVVEHPAVTRVCDFLAADGWAVDHLPVDGLGRVSPDDLARLLRDDTVLVSVMHANNEVGTIQPMAELAALAHERGALMHSDCAQSVGKIPVRVDEMGVDLLSVAGHKLYAHKGVGALYVRTGTPLEKLIHGAGHEQGRRAGTENVLGIVGLGEACAIITEELDMEIPQLRALRDRLEADLRAGCPELVINGHPELRLPNTLSVSFPGRRAGELLDRLDTVACSAGAACNADGTVLSTVLSAMGVAPEVAMGTLRLSVGRFSTEKEVDRACAAILAALI